MRRSIRNILWAALATGVIAAGTAWAVTTTIHRLTSTSSGEPQPAPPSDRMKGVPGPDNTITSGRQVGEGGGVGAVGPARPREPAPNGARP